MASSVVEHCSPAWQRRRDPKAQKTERCLGKDRARHPNAGLNKHWLNDVRDEMPKDNMDVRGSQGASSLDEVKLLHSQYLAAYQARITHPANGDQRQDKLLESRTPEGY